MPPSKDTPTVLILSTSAGALGANAKGSDEESRCHDGHRQRFLNL
jgi:hypothetical protein